MCGVTTDVLMGFESKFLLAIDYSLFISEDELLLYRLVKIMWNCTENFLPEWQRNERINFLRHRCVFFLWLVHVFLETFWFSTKFLGKFNINICSISSSKIYLDKSIYLGRNKKLCIFRENSALCIVDLFIVQFSLRKHQRIFRRNR